MEQLNVEKLTPQAQAVYEQLADTIAYERTDGRVIVSDWYETRTYRSVAAFNKALIDTAHEWEKEDAKRGL